MTKDFAVVFVKNNARIIKDPAVIAQLGEQHQFVLNPNLSKVIGVPPHLWKLADGKIVPMSDAEQIERTIAIQQEGIDNRVLGLIATPVVAIEVKRDKFKVQPKEQPKVVIQESFFQKHKFKLLAAGAMLLVMLAALIKAVGEI